MNLKLIRFLRIINKISIKFHCGRNLGNFLFGILCSKDVIKYAKIDINSFLSSIHEDVCSSSLCKNELVEPTVDLQIILPVFKVEKYLDCCLKSILNQKANYSFKLVAINDGSPDGCAEILERYKEDDRIIIINQKTKDCHVPGTKG